MEKLQCLICGKEMEEHNKIAYIDHTCNDVDYTSNQLRGMDHQLTMRIVYDDWMDGSIKMRTPRLAKLRVAFYRDKLFLKVHYDDKYTEVWAKNNTSHRNRINLIVTPDFSNIERLKNKIKTLLVFG